MSLIEHQRLTVRVRRILLTLGLVGTGLTLSIALGLDAHGKTQRAQGTYDAIVVAGCRVLEGGTPSEALERRVQLAVRLWRDGRAPRVILTGGVGTYPPSEAQAAAGVAHKLGVPRAALVLETNSRSTAENARFARRLTRARRVLIVTDSYHVYRARWVFRQHFESVDAVGSLAPLGSRAAGAIREVAAVIVYRVLALF